MAFGPGARLGPYEIQSALGAGGMGEVYKARDSRLKRDVALKILPESVASNPDRLARFQREAEVLASLNHPNIAAIHGLEESNRTRALVMELVDGETLADRIARGPIPVDDALPIARQIADALAAAHEHGIIHRDLKPSNIKLRPDGTVKVLDFGLAKALDPALAIDVSQSPTITSPAMTGLGVILGTAAYMSPEQARGKSVDKRADIWAFGCVLYEMLTGTRAFEGHEVPDVLARILEREPNFNALPPTTPAAIRRVLRRCLEKDGKRRLSDISDARIEIDEALTTPSADASTVTPVRADIQPPRWRRLLPWVLTGALGAALGLQLLLRNPSRSASPAVPQRLSAELGADASLATAVGPQVTVGSSLALSPNGSLLAFVAQTTATEMPQLYIRRIEQLKATLLGGTEGAASPFFSPDGQWVAFFAQGKLKKISVTGGPAVTLCDAENGRGGSWGDDGTIVFTPSRVGPAMLLWRVPSGGGKPESLPKPGDQEVTQRWPQVLPGGKAVLYTGNTTVGGYEDANLVVQQLATGVRKVVYRGGDYGRYLPTGHVVFIHNGTLLAAPFDVARLELTGQPVPVLEGVTSNPSTGAAQFAASDTGAIVYLAGQGGATIEQPIHWMGRDGKASVLRTTPANWSNPHFSPDGKRLALDILDGRQLDVWVYEWERDTRTRLTFDATEDRKPVWTPDGRSIVFASARGNVAVNGATNLYVQRADGTGDVQRLTDSKNPQYPASWHPNGKSLAFVEVSPQTSLDLMILPMDGDETSGWKPGKATVFLNSPFAEDEPMFSPDGRWLAYSSNESGQSEVYVRPFPSPGGKWQISTGGGVTPTWSRTRQEVLYRTGQQIMVASYTVEGNSFRAEKPRFWSQGRVTPTLRNRSLDLHPDGERLALAAAPETQTSAKQDKLVFIFNFFDELRRLAPTSR